MRYFVVGYVRAIGLLSDGLTLGTMGFEVESMPKQEYIKRRIAQNHSCDYYDITILSISELAESDYKTFMS